MSDINQKMNNEIRQLEKNVGIPSGYYSKLLSEDDWSFVIKLSAYFEAVATEALSIKCGNTKITKVFSHLEYANPKSGKIAFLLKLDVITKEQFEFLKKLAELRNKLVHTISSTNFSFDEHIEKLDKNQKNSFVKIFGHGIKEKVILKDITVSQIDFILENPKIAIWITAHEILACIHADYSTHVELETIKTKYLDTLIKSFSTKDT